MIVTLREVLAEYAELPEFVGLSAVGVSTVGNFGSTPLHVAAARGRSDEARVLLAAGALPNAPGEHGFTPLHEAAAQGHWQVCELLLAGGASTSVLNSDGESPSVIAELSKHFELARLLANAP